LGYLAGLITASRAVESYSQYRYLGVSSSQRDEGDDVSTTLAKTPAQCWCRPPQTTMLVNAVNDKKAGYNSNSATIMMSREDASAMRKIMPAQHW
jgi:hypothetical protein